MSILLYCRQFYSTVICRCVLCVDPHHSPQVYRIVHVKVQLAYSHSHTACVFTPRITEWCGFSSCICSRHTALYNRHASTGHTAYNNLAVWIHVMVDPWDWKNDLGIWYPNYPRLQTCFVVLIFTLGQRMLRMHYTNFLKALKFWRRVRKPRTCCQIRCCLAFRKLNLESSMYWNILIR